MTEKVKKGANRVQVTNIWQFSTRMPKRRQDGERKRGGLDWTRTSTWNEIENRLEAMST